MKPYIRKLTGGLYNGWGYFTVPKKIINYITSKYRWVACWLDKNYNLVLSREPNPKDINGIFLWKRYYYASSGSIQYRIPMDVFTAWTAQYQESDFKYVKIVVLQNNNLQITLLKTPN